MKGYWNNLRPFEKRVVVVVAAMLFVVFNIWFVMPHFSDWGRVQTRMTAAREKLKRYQGEVSQITTVSNQVRVLEGEGMSVPPEEQSVQFQRVIQTRAAEAQVNILSQGRVTERTNQFFLEVSQTLSLQSGEPPLVDFLYNLGAGNSLLRVRDMTLRTDAARQLLNAGVKLVLSYQKKAQARTPAAATATTQPPLKKPEQVFRNPPATNTAKSQPPASKSTTPRNSSSTNKTALPSTGKPASQPPKR
jgi:hypothetical protein